MIAGVLAGGELAGVVKIDNKTIGSGEVGPMTRHLSALYAKRTATEGAQVVETKGDDSVSV